MDMLARAMPLQGFLGGAMIGLAGAIMLLTVGRIAGVSGLLAQTFGLTSSGSLNLTAASFILGVPLGAVLTQYVNGPVRSFYPSSFTTLIVAGLFVGFGSRLGSGCTSGHGVCGLSRLSMRSLVATLAFMGAGFATTFVIRHLLSI